MKKLLLLILCFFTLLFSSCNLVQSPDEGSIGNIPEETKPFGEYFDWEKSHIPTIDEIYSVTSGMKSIDVIALLGKPHDFGPTSGIPSLSWEADNGVTYYFTFIISNDVPDDINSVEMIMKYSTVFRGSEQIATMSPEN